jgi:zinc/manganese transport system substrate-binding protein
MMRSSLMLLVVVALLTTACADRGTDTTGIRVVATTTILGDVARNLVEDDGSVEVLLPIGADPHDYQASARQVAAIQEADLVVANGLGLEEGFADVLESAAADGGNVLMVAPFLDPLPFGGGHADEDHADEDHADEDHADDDHGDEHAHAESGDDPHVWLDPLRMADASRIVAEELSKIDDSVDWIARGNAYAGALTAADTEIQAALEVVPPADRKLVTNHDALGYFANRYGFEVVGVVIPGGSTLAEPSSAELTELVTAVDQEQVRAIFAETTNPEVLADAVAAEAGEEVIVVELFTGSLGEPGSGADTLIGMLTTNAQLIAEALS